MNDLTLGVYRQAIRIVFSQRAPSDGLRELGTVVRGLTPHPIWDKLHRLQVDREFPKLASWVQAKVSSYRQSAPILYFSLSDLGDVLTLIFLQQQREPAGDHDWAAYDGSTFHQAPSNVLKRMNQLVNSELGDDAGSHTHPDVHWIVETCYPLVYAGLTVGRIMRLLPSDILLGVDKWRRVAVFFAEGDDFFFGEITPSGFRQYGVPEFALS